MSVGECRGVATQFEDVLERCARAVEGVAEPARRRARHGAAALRRVDRVGPGAERGGGLAAGGGPAQGGDHRVRGAALRHQLGVAGQRAAHPHRLLRDHHTLPLQPDQQALLHQTECRAAGSARPRPHRTFDERFHREQGDLRLLGDLPLVGLGVAGDPAWAVAAQDVVQLHGFHGRAERITDRAAEQATQHGVLVVAGEAGLVCRRWARRVFGFAARRHGMWGSGGCRRRGTRCTVWRI
nr:hypothetical protein [Nocardia puris]